MKLSSLGNTILILFICFSCSNGNLNYEKLTLQDCDSLLNTTALSSAERARVVRQYVLLRSSSHGQLALSNSSSADTCIKMLEEVISLAPVEMRTDLKLIILPFHLSKMFDYDSEKRRKIRNIMSDLENSSLTAEEQAKYLSYKAQYYTILRSPEKAFLYCGQARELFRKNNDSEGEFNSLTQISMLFMLQKDYVNALRFCDSAFLFKSYTPSPQRLQKLHSQYCQLYANVGMYKQAIEAFHESGRDSLNNSTLALLYLSSKQYDKALNIIYQHKEIHQDNPYRLSHDLRLEAQIYEATGRKEKAYQVRSEAIRLAEENSIKIVQKHPNLLGIPFAFAPIYAAQAEWAWNNGKQKEAFQLLHKAEKLNLRSNITRKENVRIMDILTDYYQQSGKYREAMIARNRRDSLQSILDSQRKPEDYQKMIAEHELEMFEATINKQKAEKQNIHSSYISIGIGLVLSSISIILATFYLRTLKQIRNMKRKQSKQKK